MSSSKINAVMKLGLGTVQFGLDYGISNMDGKTSLDEVKKILTVAKNHKICIIDTASLYGTSEEILGMAMQGKREFHVVTKTPKFGEIIASEKIRFLEKTFKNSLKNMRCSKVYGLLIHHADDLLGVGGNLLLEKMNELKEEGFVDKIGVSVYSAEQIDKILDKFNIDLIQIPINVLDQRLLTSGHLAKLKKSGVEIHARSAFLQGLLLMPPATLSSYFDSIKPHLSRYHESLREYALTPLQAALSFVSAIDEIDVVVCGVNNHSQLEEICESLKRININDFFRFSLSDEDFLNPSKWKN